MKPSPIVWQPSLKDTSTEAESVDQISTFISYVNAEHKSNIQGARELYDWSIRSPEQFWQSVIAFLDIHTHTACGPVLVSGETMRSARWFPEYQLNFAENLLAPAKKTPAKTAIRFFAEDQIEQTISYETLYQNSAGVAAYLSTLGLEVGDRVAAITPNTPHAIIAMLAATGHGYVWSSCSPDFGVTGIVDRFAQIAPRVLFVADGYYYKGRYISILDTIAAALQELPSVETVILFSIKETPPTAIPFSCTLWNTLLDTETTHEFSFPPLPFNHPLCILFSSGTTGTPKCIVHGAGGTLLEHLKEHRLHADVTAKDVYFYSTTCGWMMWNYLVSTLACGCTLILYDGFPLLNEGRFLLQLIEQEKITVFGTSAGFISALQKQSYIPKQISDLSSLRLLLSTGSVLTPENFDFVYAKLSATVQLSSISGGTDIIGCFALGCATLPVRRGELQSRSLGYAVSVFDDDGQPVVGQKGELVCTAPFPSMPLYFWNDPDGTRYQAAYFERFPGIWCHGDYVLLTEEGGMIFYGRSDAVLNPGGVRIGTAEIYRQLEDMQEIEKSLAVAHCTEQGEAIILFVVMKNCSALTETILLRIKNNLRKHASPRHVPQRIIAAPDIPVTRSGKVSELTVKKLIHGESIDNTEAIANPECLDFFRSLSI